MGFFLGKNKKTQQPNATPMPVSPIAKGMVSVADIIAPSSCEVDFNFVRVNEAFYKTFFVVGYPRFVSGNWLSPLIDFSHSLNISMFIYPTLSGDVLSDLRRKIAEMEATVDSQEENGQLADPTVEATLEDALNLQEELAKGVERFFQFSFYITLAADTKQEIEEGSKRLLTVLSSILESRLILYFYLRPSSVTSLVKIIK